MDQIEIITPEKVFSEKPIAMPGSKSMTNRALVMAALSEGTVKIINHLWSDDVSAMVDCLRELGLKVIHCKDYIQVIGDIKDIKDREYKLDARLSGTTMRFILALCCIVPGIQTLGGEKSLNDRPIKDLVDSLIKLGAKINYLEKEGHPPVMVESSAISGHKTSISGVISSQFLTALLLISPTLDGLEIDIDGKQASQSYIDMTLHLMKEWGVVVANHNYARYEISAGQKYNKEKYTVESDFSAAAYFGAMAALSGSELTLKNLNPASTQGDKQLFEVLKQMGNEVEYVEGNLKVAGCGVKSMDINLESYPDQAQTLAVLLAFADGKSTLTGVRSLRVKETERVKALQTGLLKMGIKTESPAVDTLIIYGGNPHGASIDTYGDHRMAMSFAVAGVKISGMKINEPQVVNKTFPGFWEKMESVGVKILRLSSRA